MQQFPKTFTTTPTILIIIWTEGPRSTKCPLRVNQLVANQCIAKKNLKWYSNFIYLFRNTQIQNIWIRIHP